MVGEPFCFVLCQVPIHLLPSQTLSRPDLSRGGVKFRNDLGREQVIIVSGIGPKMELHGLGDELLKAHVVCLSSLRGLLIESRRNSNVDMALS